MKIEYRNGDALQAPERFIAHGCNTHGVGNSGFFGALKKVYPHAHTKYVETYVQKGLRLGETIWVEGEPHTVIHCITQKNFGPNAKFGFVYCDYDAIRNAFRNIELMAQASQSINDVRNYVGLIDAVAMPKIGAGLAGGDWDIISDIIETEAISFKPVVYIL